MLTREFPYRIDLFASLLPNFRLSIGSKLILAYCLLYFVFPAVGNYIFDQQIQSIYRNDELSLFGFLCGIVVFLVAAFVDFKSKPGQTMSEERSDLNRPGIFFKTRSRFRTAAAIVSFFLGLLFFFDNLSSYRYTHLRIADRSSGLLMLGLVFQSIISVLLLFEIFIREQLRISTKQPFCKVRWCENILFALALFFLADGTLGAFHALVFLACILFPTTSLKLLLFQTDAPWRVRLVRSSILILALLPMFAVSWAYGEWIKVSSSQVALPVVEANRPQRRESDLQVYFGGLIALDRVEAEYNLQRFKTRMLALKDRVIDKVRRLLSGQHEPSIEASAPIERVRDNRPLLIRIHAAAKSFVDRLQDFTSAAQYIYLTERLSSHYYSLQRFFRSDFRSAEDPELNHNAFFYPARTVLFRLDQLFFFGTLGIVRPSVASVSQLNYQLLVNIAPRPREGTSPGPIGTFLYAANTPIAMILVLIYLLLAKALLNSFFLLPANVQMSPIALILVMTQTQIFFDSPIDLLQILDNGSFKAFGFLFIALRIACAKKKLSVRQH